MRVMNEMELRKHAECSVCHKKIGHNGALFFWIVKIERFMVDMRNIERQDGLSAFYLGNAVLANVMGDDKDMAQAVTKPIELTLCERCAVDANYPIAHLAELVSGSDR